MTSENLYGGCDLVVVAGAFLIHVIADGFVYNFGIIEEELIESEGTTHYFVYLGFFWQTKGNSARRETKEAEEIQWQIRLSGHPRHRKKKCPLNRVVHLFVMTRKEHTSLSGCIQDKGVSCNYTSYFVDRRHRIQQRRKVVEQQQQAAELNFSNNNSAAKDTRRVFALSTPGRVVHRLLRLVHRHESMRLNVKPQIPHPVEYINAEPLVVHYGSFIVMYVKAKHLAMEHRCLCNAANQEIDRLNYKTDQVSERKLRDFISYVQDQLQYGKYEIEKVLDTVSDLSIKIDTFGQSFSIVGRMPIICRNIRIAAIFFIQQISARVHGERELLISKIKRILTQKRETKQYSSMHPDACSSWALWALSFVDPKLIAALMNRSISCNRQAII